MFFRKKSRSSDESADVPAWIVTFSDCMTLLLCFFVMMVTFSSFDEAALHQIAGVFEHQAYHWIFFRRHDVKDSVMEELDRPIDRTPEGSETPTQSELEMIKFPRPPLEGVGREAYRDRQTFYLPSARLFYGQGCSLKPEGARALRRIASFMELVPCRVIISEMCDSDEPGVKDMSVERAWTVMRYFVEKAGLPDSRFNISAGQRPPSGRPPGESVVRIDLLARSIYE